MYHFLKQIYSIHNDNARFPNKELLDTKTGLILLLKLFNKVMNKDEVKEILRENNSSKISDLMQRTNLFDFRSIYSFDWNRNEGDIDLLWNDFESHYFSNSLDDGSYLYLIKNDTNERNQYITLSNL